MNEFTRQMPEMLFGEQLKVQMRSLPEYTDEYRFLSPRERLLRLSDLYKVFVPQTMATEIYSKMYMMTVMSLEQKGTTESVKQMNANHRWASGGEYCGTITGASSATVIGTSGVGKTTCIQKATRLLGPVLETAVPLRKIVPVVTVTCPFDSNYKGLLCQILICIDEALGTEYYNKTRKSAYNAQQIMAMVCQLCQLHVGILIIDEIQFLVEHKAGTQLYRMILQLINASGISVMLVGTQECLDYFTQAPQMARRTTGLQYDNMEYGKNFRELTEILFGYQYVSGRAELTEGLTMWLYEHSAGNPANLMALIHDAQEVAILKGTEKIDIAAFTEAYTNRLKMLHPYIECRRGKLSQTGNVKKEEAKSGLANVRDLKGNVQTIPHMAQTAKDNCEEIVTVYRKAFMVEEIVL